MQLVGVQLAMEDEPELDTLALRGNAWASRVGGLAA
jgi:hypothetical protein